MNIYKLKYTNKQAALTDLKVKNVYVEQTIEGQTELMYGEGIQAVVEIGLIVLTPGTYDNEGNEITAPVYADGYHYDIMCIQEIDFGSAKIEPTNPKHAFAGYPISQEV
jgi:hypothetical protein